MVHVQREHAARSGRVRLAGYVAVDGEPEELTEHRISDVVLVELNRLKSRGSPRRSQRGARDVNVP